MGCDNFSHGGEAKSPTNYTNTNYKKITNNVPSVQTNTLLTNKNKTIPPKIEWVEEYCKERKSSVDPHKFFDHYESINWFRGKTKIKDWQATLRTWESKNYENNGSGNQSGRKFLN